MKTRVKQILSVVLCFTMVISSTLPCMAQDKNENQETNVSKIVEQLKEDLGEEKFEELIKKDSLSDHYNGIETSSEDSSTNSNEEINLSIEEQESNNLYEEPEEDDEINTEEDLDVKNAILEIDESSEIISESESDIENDENDTNNVGDKSMDDITTNVNVVDEKSSSSSDKILDNTFNEDINNFSNENNLIDEEIILATKSEIDDLSVKIVADSVKLLDVATCSETTRLFGVGEPWMYWYLTDGGQTIHYSSTEPSSGGHSITYNYITYSELTKSDIRRAVFDDIINAQTAGSLFFGFENLVEIDNISNFNTSNVATMQSMFWGCSSLINIDVTSFDTSNVTNMSGMFYGCKSLESIDISNFNTSNVTDMSNMFACYQYNNSTTEHESSLQNINGLNSIDTSSVTNMSSIFSGCSRLTSINVSNFNTNNVTNMSGMFQNCYLLGSIDLSGFNTNNVTDMSLMFSGCLSLISLDVSNFNTENVTNMKNMFSCYKYDYSTSEYRSSLTSIVGLSTFNTSNVRSMSCMFMGLVNMTSIDVSSFNTSSVTTAGNQEGMYGMFMQCKNLQSLDLSSFNTQNVKIFNYMFGYCESIEELDLSSFDTSSAVDCRYMFNGCYSLQTLDISNFDLSNCPNNESMIARCGELRTLKISQSLGNIINNYCKMSYDWQRQGDSTIYYYDNINNKTTFPNIAGLYTRVDASNRVTVTFDSNGGSYVYAQTVNLGETINEPEIPTKDNSLFLGWYDETLTNLFDFSSPINNSVTLYANWQNVTIVSMYWYIENGTDLHLSSTMPTSIAYVDGQTFDKFDYNGTNIPWLPFRTNITKVVFDNLIQPTYCRSLFRGLSNLTQFVNMNYLDTSECVSMYGMFYECSSLANIDVSGFDTSKVTDMQLMFHKCDSLESLNLSNFNTSNVTNMSGMFSFYNTSDNPALMNLNVSSFDTSKVTNMQQMFCGLKNLTSLDVSNFDTSKVTNMTSMFWYCTSLTSINVSSFNTSRVISMNAMFDDCSSLTNLNVSNFDTSKVTDMQSMFSGCEGLNSINLSSFDTSKVGNMRYMFEGCESITNLNLSNFDTSNVINMQGMFSRCDALSSLNLSSFDTSKVTDMSSMFSICRSLNNLNISSFNTSEVTNMSQMFHGCSSLSSIDLSDFDTSKVTDMMCMFAGCSQIESINLSSFVTNNVVNMRQMFSGNWIMTTILANENFITTAITEADNNHSSEEMFFGCQALIGGNNTPYDSSHTDKEYARVDVTGTPGYFTYSAPPTPSGSVLSNITINLPPTTVKYKVGESFDPTGLKINLNYSDSSTDTVTYNTTTSADFTFSQTTPFDTAGATIGVTIYYGGKTCVQNVEVIEPTSISVKPNTNLKVKYAIDESFDPTNLFINVTYSDTTTVETVSYTGNESDFSFNPSTLDTAGASIPVTITWTNNGNDFTCTQSVEVVELSTISINLPPATTRYIKGTNFDPTGLKINLNYSDSTTDTVIYSTSTSGGFTFNGASTLTLNTVGNPFVITIGYAGKTCEQNVIVAELSGIAITTHATKLNYNEGDTFDPTGLVITLTYSDSVTQPIAYNTTTSSDFTFSPTGALTRTGNVITIQYKTFSTMTMEETLNVKELTSIAVTTNPAKLSYASGQSLNPNGLVLTLTYTDSNDAVTTDTVTYNSTTQNKFAFNPSGVLTSSGNITITYDGKTGTNLNPTFAITVYQIASISVVNRPSTTSYNVGSKLNPNGLVIKVNKVGGASENIAYSSGNSSDFTFNPSLSTNLNTGHTNVTVTYGGKSTTFEISVTQSSGGYVPSGGGGSTGGGGGGGGGGGIPTGNNPLNNTPTTTQVAANKSISATISGDTSSWVADPISGKWKLNVTLGNGQVAPASNGFYLLTNTITEVINGIIVPKQVNNTYYFDVQGNMITGWVQTADSKWYFFENAKTAEEGKMSIGWKQVQGSWYYFTLDGSMMASGITPDGFIIGADGKWVQ